MITIATVNKLIICNLVDFTREHEFKEVLLNFAINRTAKKLKIKFRHAYNNAMIGSTIVNTDEVVSIEVEERKYYVNRRYFEVKNLYTMEEICQSTNRSEQK